MFTLTDFHKRLLFTLGLILFWRIAAFIPVPGIDSEAFDNFLGSANSFGFYPRVSVAALGLMPYISAYVLVEILALFVPPLKSWRKGGYPGRKKLKKTALLGTLFLALVQSYGIAQGLERMNDGLLVLSPGFSFRLIVISTITTATFLTLWIADMITKRGIGHGISVLIVTGYVGGLFWRFSKINKDYYSQSPFEILFIIILVGAAITTLIVLAEKSHRKFSVKLDNGKEAYIPIKLTTAGIVPVSLASSFVMFSAIIIGFIANPTLQKIASELSPGKIGYSIVMSLTIIFLYYLFTAFFYNPKKIVAFLKTKNASVVVPPGKKEEDYIDRSLEIMALFGSLYLCILILLPEFLIFVFGWPIFLGGVNLIITVAVALDLFEESRIRRESGRIVKVAEFHDIPKAGLLRSILVQEGIPCYLKGYYHRALLYFFGPYIEVSV